MGTESLRRDPAISVALIGAGNLARWEHLPAISRSRVQNQGRLLGPRRKGRATHFGSKQTTPLQI